MPAIRFSSNRQDIIDINRRSAESKTGISIIELSMLDGLMDKETAESIRQSIITKKVPVRQLTNLSEIYAEWTQFARELQELMQIRYISQELFDIQNEMLIFDDIVAIYRVEPDISYIEIEDPSYASMMRTFFDNLWNISQAMIWWIGWSAHAKQYLPFTREFQGIPMVIYPAKDDGNISQAYSRGDPSSIISYLDEVLPLYREKIMGADTLICYIWNDGTVPMVDVWKVMRNSISDDSGFLYDGFTIRWQVLETSMWLASGNSLIVFTAEEILFRELIMNQGKTFLEAADRGRYFPAFPAWLVPSESYFTK